MRGQRIANKGFQAYELLPDVLGATLCHEFETARRNDQLSPERMLFYVILTDALEVLQGHRAVVKSNGSAEVLRQETIDWFLSEDESWTFSFRRACLALDLEANVVLRKIADKLPEQKGKAHGNKLQSCPSHAR